MRSHTLWKRLAIGLVAVAAFSASESPAQSRLDLALYAELLGRNSRETADLVGTRVDYRALRSDLRWRELLGQLERSRPTALSARNQRLAFWINAYNILAIQMVARHYPVDSIKDAGSFFWPVWKREAGRIGGEPVTLGQIEHEILRPLGEPRIHAAIVCASTSCPSLMRTPFEPSRLDGQLDAATRRWLSSPEKGMRIDRDARRVTLSRIFDWFDEDFEAAGGALAFAARYARDGDRQWIEAHARDLSIDYFDYDWTLNDLARGG